MLRRATATTLLAVFCSSIALQAVDSEKAAYFGGSIDAFADAKDPVEGRLETRGDHLVLTAESRPFAGWKLTIPYNSIIDLEYGQKAGRRVGAAVTTTVLLGPIGLLSLLSKKRKHFLTIGFKDDANKDQVVVLELGKDIVRATLPIVETRSGKKIEYQDEEAKKF
jgi:hypothetical protein